MKINAETIVLDNNPLLREKSQDVIFPLSNEDKKTLLSMLKYVRDSIDPELAEKENLKPAVGIAAPQIGILKKMTAISFENELEDGTIYKTEYALINPKIISHSVKSSYLKNGEGCLSVEEKHEGYVKRHYRIKVKAYDLLQEKEVIITSKDFEAIVLQHEIDHLFGILFYDHIDKENPFKDIENAIVID